MKRGGGVNSTEAGFTKIKIIPGSWTRLHYIGWKSWDYILDFLSVVDALVQLQLSSTDCTGYF